MSGVEDTLRDGFLARSGLLPDDAIAEAADLIERVQRDRIETIRILCSDPHGILRGKTVTAEAFASVFTTGVRVPSTVLLKDISNRTVFPIWSGSGDTPFKSAGDIVLVPVPASFQALPWSPHSALLHCGVASTAGEEVPFSSRAVLSRAMAELGRQGLRAVMGLEVEFQVYEVTDAALDHGNATMPGRPPETRLLNQGYQYLADARYGAAEQMLDLLRRNAQGLGMPVRSVEIEFGPSQFEFTFAPADPMTVADMAVTFRTMAKEICRREGLHATFMTKPKFPDAAASGWHIHQSVCDAEGRNLFAPPETGGPSELTPAASGWIAGLLKHAAASCIATTPTVNGYKRYTAHQLAPDRIGWGVDNRGAMIRVLTSPGDPSSRIENRVADSAANPYFALAFQLLSGLDGVVSGLQAPDVLSDPYDTAVERLPDSLHAAIDAFAASEFYRQSLGETFVSYLTRLKSAEWQRYAMAVSDWEQAEYFSAF